MKQGDIYWIQLEPSVGKEQIGLRPCVIISGNGLNSIVGISIICPLTKIVKNYKGCVVLHPNKKNQLKKTSEVLVHQIRIVDHGRFKNKIGEISSEEIQLIHEGLRLILKY